MGPTKKLLAEAYFKYVKHPKPGVCPVRGCVRASKKGRALCSKHNLERYRGQNPLAAYLCRLRNHAKDRGIPFHVTLPHFKEVWDASDFDPGGDRPSQYKHYPSVDRIDARLPYQDGNIQILTVSANAMKSHRENYVDKWWERDPNEPVPEVEDYEPSEPEEMEI